MTASPRSIVGLRLLIPIALVLALAVQPAAAQSDGTLEELYAAQCPQHQDTRVCKTLREAMENEAASLRPSAREASIEAQWGPLAQLAGATLELSSGNVQRYRWLVPGQQMEIEDAHPTATALSVLTLGKDGRITGEVVTGLGARFPFSTTFPRRGALIHDYPSLKLREAWEFGNGPITLTLEKFEEGRWTPTGTYTSTLLRGNAGDGAMTRVQQAYAAPPKVALGGWGMLPHLAGSWWRGANNIWLVQRGTNKIDWKGKVVPGGPERYQVQIYDNSGLLLSNQMIFTLDDRGILRSREYPTRTKVAFLPDGAFFISQWNHALKQTGRDSFEWTPGKLGANGFVPDPTLALLGSGRYVRVSAAENPAFNALIANRAEQQRLAEASRKSENSGLMGAVAMATGAAIAGGNAEMIYGAALKGAEMTTTNEGLRSGLAGQGEAMIGAGAQRMAAERAPVSQGQTMASAAPPPIGSTVSASSANMAPLRVYFWVPTVIHAGDTRNTLCYSNVLTLGPIDLNARSNTAAEAMIAPYRERFLNKCRQYRQLDGQGTFSYHETTRGQPPRDFDPRDYRVVMP